MASTTTINFSPSNRDNVLVNGGERKKYSSWPTNLPNLLAIILSLGASRYRKWVGSVYSQTTAYHAVKTSSLSRLSGSQSWRTFQRDGNISRCYLLPVGIRCLGPLRLPRENGKKRSIFFLTETLSWNIFQHENQRLEIIRDTLRTCVTSKVPSG